MNLSKEMLFVYSDLLQSAGIEDGEKLALYLNGYDNDAMSMFRHALGYGYGDGDGYGYGYGYGNGNGYGDGYGNGNGDGYGYGFGYGDGYGYKKEGL